jgi:ubiquinone/menaquinone biosynthesis C-methylase UbiE
MRIRLHLAHGHRHGPGTFEGRRTRLYDLLARTLMRGFYHRLAADAEGAVPPGGAVLDVGTGPGVLLAELAKHRPDVHVTGVDLSADMAAAATRNLARYGDRATARVADVADLPFADGSFDLVVTSLSVHHWEHPETAVPELARVLRPGGRLYVYDFPSAPFDTLVDAARDASLFTAAPPARTPFRTGTLVLGRCVRLVMVR